MGSASVLVLNGPNINMLGIREPGIYGSESYTDLLQLCQDTAAEVGFDKCTCYQSNHEGDLVDAIQNAMGKYDGIVINPGAYTHTSIAILDAAKAVRLPIVEVHISKVEERGFPSGQLHPPGMLRDHQRHGNRRLPQSHPRPRGEA